MILTVPAFAVGVAAAALVISMSAGSAADRDRAGAIAFADEPSPTVDDGNGFLRAWRRSLDTGHAATGTITRTALDEKALYTSAWPDPADGDPGSSATVLAYRHARADGRQLTQIGDVATLHHPSEGSQTCLRRSSGFVCSPDSGPPDVGAPDGGQPGHPAAPDETAATVAQAVTGDSATHIATAVDPTEILAAFPALPDDVACWELRSRSDGFGHRWGRRAQFCFHVPTGAAVFRRVLGVSRVEVLVVDSVADSVRPGDLEPV